MERSIAYNAKALSEPRHQVVRSSPASSKHPPGVHLVQFVPSFAQAQTVEFVQKSVEIIIRKKGDQPKGRRML